MGGPKNQVLVVMPVSGLFLGFVLLVNNEPGTMGRDFRGVTEGPGEDRNTIGILEIFHIQINKNDIYMKIS